MRRSSAAGPRAAVTLPELLIVCAILGVMAATTLPRLELLRPKADAGMRLVRVTLQQAQRLAVQHQYDVVVSVDATGRRLRVAEDSTNDRVIGPRERVRWIPLDDAVHFATPPAPLPGGVGGAAMAGDVRTVNGYPSVTFHRSGAASGDVEIYLEGRRGSRRDVRAVRVTHSTGRTDWFRWIDGAWREGDL